MGFVLGHIHIQDVFGAIWLNDSIKHIDSAAEKYRIKTPMRNEMHFWRRRLNYKSNCRVRNQNRDTNSALYRNLLGSI